MSTWVEKCALCGQRYDPYHAKRSQRSRKFRCCSDTCAVREEARLRRNAKDRARGIRSYDRAQKIFYVTLGIFFGLFAGHFASLYMGWGTLW